MRLVITNNKIIIIKQVGHKVVTSKAMGSSYERSKGGRVSGQNSGQTEKLSTEV